MMKHYLAFDLGATSGRAIIGSVDSQGSISLKEIHRFPNTMIRRDNIKRLSAFDSRFSTYHLYWDWSVLTNEIKVGLTKAGQTGLPIESVGIDTWGVDVLFVDKAGKPLGNPYAYRDAQTDGAPEHFFEHVMSSRDLYARTGIQVMNFNTLFQLYTLRHREDPYLMQADKILFLPDAFNYWLTGQMATEYTIASTSQLLNAQTRQLDEVLLHSVGLTPRHFAPIVEPGTVLGTILPSIAEECHIPQWRVVAVAGHDTASAVASLRGNNWHRAYLSSGTWSLLGVELKQPVLTPEAQQHNITNEGGVHGSIRFLKNITGMWLIEGLRHDWEQYGYSYADMMRLAEQADGVAIINPDDPIFAAPTSMRQAIDTYCRTHQLRQPQTHGEYLRCVYESLAQRYAQVLAMIQSLIPYTIEELHIIGGGSQNTFLNKLTATATGLPVVIGSAEATAMGNIYLQSVCQYNQEQHNNK